jgi:hypothetical protein
MGLTSALGCADESGNRPDDGGLGDQEEAAGQDEFGCCSNPTAPKSKFPYSNAGSLKGRSTNRGREGIQKRAIEELIHQSEPPELYASIEELLANYRTKLSTYRTITPDEEELIMNLSAAYLKKIDEAKREGRTEGRTESHIEIAQRLLRENSPLEFISRVTDLPIATLQQLQRSL